MERTPVLLRAGLISLLLLAAAASGNAQYEFTRYFDTYAGLDASSGGCHGLAVDPDGNVWVQYYNATALIEDDHGVSNLTHAIYIFRPDGTQLPFSPIRYITADSVTDTLYLPTGRGLGTDHDGNILASFGSTLYKIDYRTGSGLKRYRAGTTLTAAAGDSTGRVFVGSVLPDIAPLEILDGATLASLGFVVDTTSEYSRSLAVSTDGKTVYWAGYSNHCVYVYRSPTGAPGTFTLADTILKGFDAESFAIHPRNRQLWASSGSGNDRPNRYPGLVTNYLSHTWYAYDPESGLIVDTVSWRDVYDSLNTRPRAVAFSPTGDTMYVGMYGDAMYSTSVQQFINRHSTLLVAGQYDPDSATVLLLHMNEVSGSVAQDSSGAGNHAILEKTAIVAGRFGLGRRFGAGGYGGRVANAPALNPSPALTLEAWFKPASLAGQSTIIAKPGPDGQSGYMLQILGNGGILAFGINTKLSATLFASVVPESLMNGRWHHIAGTYDGSDARVYLDGVLLVSGALGVTPGTSSTDSVIIGQGFDGALDEVRISSVARQPGDLGFVQPPTALKAMAIGNAASVSWKPPSGRVEAASYQVSYKDAYSSWWSMGFTQRPSITLRCALPGTINVKVASVDAAGNISGSSAEITVTSNEYQAVSHTMTEEIMLADVYAAVDSPWTVRTKSFYPSPTGWTDGTGNGWVRHPPFTNWCSTDLDPIDVRLAGLAGEARATVLAYRIDTPQKMALSFGIPDSAGAASGPVRFVVQVEDTTGKITPLADTVVTGRNQGGVLQADLSPWTLKRIILRLIASPALPSTSGQVFWGDPLVGAVLFQRILTESEPNDTVSRANVITRGDTVQGGITPAGDQDYYAISVAAEDTLEINAYTGVEGQIKWPGELTLLDSTGQVLAHSQVPSADYPFEPRARVRLAAGPAGKYFVRFRRGPGWDYSSADTGRYTLAVRRFIPAAPILAMQQSVAMFYDSVHFLMKLAPNGRPTTVLLESGSTYPATQIATLGPFDSIGVLDMIASIPVSGSGQYQSVLFSASNDFGSTDRSNLYFNVPPPPSGWTRLWQRTMENVVSLSFADGRLGAMTTPYSLYLTADSGLTWQKANRPAGGGELSWVARPDSSLLFVVRSGVRICRSINGGTSWTELAPSVDWISTMVFPDKNHGFAGTGSGQILFTTNGGASWSRRILTDYQSVTAILFVDSLHGFAAAGTKIYQTADGGLTWNPSPTAPSTGYNFSALIKDANGAILAAGAYSMLRSTNGGLSWETRSLPVYVQSGASLDNGRTYLVGYDGAILFSGDGGVNWSQQSSGTSNLLRVAAKTGNRVLVGGEAGVLLRSMEGGTVAVEEAVGIPGTFALYQNYPNPFNPMTRIRFDLSASSHVRLQVYNTVGQLVATLLEEDRAAGRHEAAFSPTQLASGVYFYRIQATPLAGGEKTFTETKKMILLH